MKKVLTTEKKIYICNKVRYLLGCPLKSDRARTFALGSRLSLSLSSLKDKKKSYLALLSNMICARGEIRRN
jgi:hypothetical protein